MNAAVYESLWETISSGEVWRGDLENRVKEGRVFWVHVSISPIKDAEGRVLRYFAVKEDITEAKYRQDEARLARVTEARSEEYSACQPESGYKF